MLVNGDHRRHAHITPATRARVPGAIRVVDGVDEKRSPPTPAQYLAPQCRRGPFPPWRPGVLAVNHARTLPFSHTLISGTFARTIAAMTCGHTLFPHIRICCSLVRRSSV